MNTTFWLQFTISMVVAAAQAELSNPTTLANKPNLKAALEQQVLVGAQIAQAITNGN
jgi:hypothetical protein